MSAVDPWGQISVPPRELVGPLFRWYYSGKGKDYIIERHNFDLYNTLWGSKQTLHVFEQFKADQVVVIQNKARSICNNHNKGMVRGFYNVGIANKMGYNMNVTNVKGLWSIGQTHIDAQFSRCHLTADCCKKTVDYVCNAEMQLNDSFSDAWDTKNQWPGDQELLGGHPFKIESHYLLNYGGSTSW